MFHTSRAPLRMPSRLVFSTVLSLAAAIGCQSAPADLREWKASDHEHTTNSGAEEKGQSTGESKAAVLGLDEVTLTTWQNNCIVCHGKIGRGDGPQSPLYKPRDLTDREWQTTVTDEQLLASIQNGKGKMPGFALPESTALGLVKLIRMLGGTRPAAARTPAPPAAGSGTAPQPAAADSTSAAPHPASSTVPASTIGKPRAP